MDELGGFIPSIELESNLAISLRPDPIFANGLKMPGAFSGTILNRKHIGMAGD